MTSVFLRRFESLHTPGFVVGFWMVVAALGGCGGYKVPTDAEAPSGESGASSPAFLRKAGLLRVAILLERPIEPGSKLPVAGREPGGE